MEPKFQSSFIPKGPMASPSGARPLTQAKKGGLFGLISMSIFVISLVLAAGVFGYKFYLRSNISQMGEDLRAAQTTLAMSETQDFIRLDNRILSAKDLINSHVALSPLFDFLEESTLQSVRFNEFAYRMTPEGIELSMFGQARGFAAVALQSDIFNKSAHFENPSFSDLALDESGNVTFSFSALVKPTLISYKRLVEVAPQAELVPTATTTDEADTEDTADIKQETPASSSTSTSSSTN